MERLQPADVAAWVATHLAPRAATRRKLAVHIWSHAAAKAAGLASGGLTDTAAVEAMKTKWGFFEPATALDLGVGSPLPA